MADLLLFPPASLAAEQEETPAPSDLEARRQALDTTRSFVVEAPAGSGKTGLLIQRFLKLLALDSVTDPAQVLAVTFTKKATSEMRDRVWCQLLAASENHAPENAFDRLTRPLAEAALVNDRRQGWNLLGYPRQLNLRTIDSISAEIAGSLPVLSGAAAGLTPIEESKPLFAQAARRTMMLLGGPDRRLHHALELILLHRDANLANCETLIADMLQWRDQWGDLVPVSPTELDDAWLDTHVLPRLEEPLKQSVCLGLTHLSETFPAPLLEALCALASEMSDSPPHIKDRSPIAICAGRILPPQTSAEDFEHWQALLHLLLTAGDKKLRAGFLKNHLFFDIDVKHRTRLKGIVDQLRTIPGMHEALCLVDALPPATYPPEQWVVTKALFRVLNRALVELQIVFAESGQCDFAEIGLQARAALRRDSAVEDLNTGAGINLQHLLVDEMQDTSTSQYELIQLLTRRWDGHSQTVFLVGDPKQSIYLFRQARVERFVQTMIQQALGDLPLTTLKLTANFRSQATLVANFNQDFARIFPAETDPAHAESVPYTAAQPIRAAQPEHARTWHTLTLPYIGNTEERASVRGKQRTQDARSIRKIIQQWLARPLPPGRTTPWKIAILVRNRIHLKEIIPALKQPHPVPFRAVDIEPLGERQEILDLIALTRALLHLGDRTAWLALLRTPWCGLTLADLHLLAGQDDPSFAESTIFELISTRKDLLTEDGIARLTPFHAILQAALTQRSRMRIALWVERTWRSFHSERFASPEELANVERYFALLEQLELPGGRIDLDQLTTRLTRLYATPSTHPGAVDIMTIHGAKGLEWDVVFVPALERLAPPSPNRLLNWLEIQSFGDTAASGILAPIQAKGLTSERLNLWMRRIDADRVAAERKRLFYVACTRAREELHLYAAPALRKSGELSPPSNSLLAAAFPAVQEIFDTAPTNLLTMPRPEQTPEDHILPALAASSNDVQPRIIRRIPHAPTSQPLPSTSTSPQMTQPFERPEGSYASRAFGNAVHAFMQQLGIEAAEGKTLDSLLKQLPSWHPRITLALRAGGLPPSQLESLAGKVLLALRTVLTDPAGRWILSPHPGARTEASTTIVSSDGHPKTIRLDRLFHAGSGPSSVGEDHLWVIDYKTATPGGRDLNTFLAEEREKYKPQMDAYATALGSTSRPLRLALYYVMIPSLILY